MPALKRTSQVFPIADFERTKAQLLAWASRYSSCAFLDNHHYPSDFHTHECLVAAGVQDAIAANAGEAALQQLQHFIERYAHNWIFGHLGYGLKIETEPSNSAIFTPVDGFPDMQFFVPETVVRIQATTATVECLHEQPEAVWQKIISVSVSTSTTVAPSVVLQPLLTKNEYLETVHKLQQHILRGDCYEINFCLPFVAEKVTMDPVAVFEKLCQVSPMPFACFYRQQQQYLLCASPERFLQKTGNHISSQPMKGTAPRHAEPVLDTEQLRILQTSQKERSENVMVADLVRNDLSKICDEGSVHADILFGIQTYPQVHQMVSTISGKIKENISFTDIIRATFPMGSMTGAPKKRVMELIDEYELRFRGLFSGSVGYINPEGDFDFNVVIRSLLYNASTQQLQYFAGSAITFYSQPEQEYEEVMLKTKAVRSILKK